jgi:predicted transcriptional regulator
MGDRATITFHTTPEMKARLERLAISTHRSKSSLSHQALERFLDEQEAFLAAVEEGLADLDAGRSFSAAEVALALREVIEAKAAR